MLGSNKHHGQLGRRVGIVCAVAPLLHMKTTVANNGMMFWSMRQRLCILSAAAQRLCIHYQKVTCKDSSMHPVVVLLHMRTPIWPVCMGSSTMHSGRATSRTRIGATTAGTCRRGRTQLCPQHADAFKTRSWEPITRTQYMSKRALPGSGYPSPDRAQPKWRIRSRCAPSPRPAAATPAERAPAR